MNASHGFFELQTDNMDMLRTYLQSHANFGDIKVDGDMLTAFLTKPLEARALNIELHSQGIVLTHLVKRKESLEEQFLELTKN